MKINKIGKILARLIKTKGKKTQINTTRSEKGEVTTDNREVQRLIRNYYKQLYANKWTTYEKITNLPKLNQKEVENMNRSVTSTESETVI